MKVYSCASVVALLNQKLGPEACERLVSLHGGQRLEIPVKVRGKLVETLGADILAVLVDGYGGSAIHVPSGGHSERVLRALRLQHDILNSDLSLNELALKHGVTAVWAQRLRSRICGPAAKPANRAEPSQPARKSAR